MFFLQGHPLGVAEHLRVQGHKTTGLTSELWRTQRKAACRPREPGLQGGKELAWDSHTASCRLRGCSERLVCLRPAKAVPGWELHWSGLDQRSETLVNALEALFCSYIDLLCQGFPALVSEALNLSHHEAKTSNSSRHGGPIPVVSVTDVHKWVPQSNGPTVSWFGASEV